jgi:hypothetical protein
MAVIKGARTVEIEAPLQRCFDLAADVQTASRWQRSLLGADVLERDGEGRPALVEARNDAKVKEIRSRLRFAYDPPHRITWHQERGDVKALRGSWTLEALGPSRTRATYGLEVDTGTMLGLLVRGPVEAQVREYVLGDAAEGLKRQAEG